MTPRCGVVGSPIRQSLSPALHEAAYARIGLDWRFTAHEVAAGGLAAFCARLGPEWRGLAVTMPLKAEALGLAGAVSVEAGAAAAANTLVRDGGGWSAHNTDVTGIRAALHEAGVGAPVEVAAVLGGGATARSAVVALAGLASRAEVYVRSPQRHSAIASAASAAGIQVVLRAWAERAAAWSADAVVSAAPFGAMDADAAALPADVRGVLLDVVYEPWPTALAAAWQSRGGPVAGGLDMLVHQAAAQLRLMTGRAVGVDVLRAAVAAARREQGRA